MNKRLMSFSAVWLFALAAPALAQAPSVEAVTVTARDPAGLLERAPSDTVFGLSKPLLETPRAASFASATTLDRYGVRTLDDLIAVSPGAFTDSYYGVPGSLSLRGTLAENYFRGFKRVENRGTYPTPLPAAERVEIVRGPPTPVYGPGKVGGLMNFVPKTARAEQGFITDVTGEVEGGVGAYGLTRLSGQVGAPVKLAAGGGLYAYAEMENAGGYYHGVHPDHQLGELSADLDLGQGWTFAAGGMLYRAHGYVQTPGWNRLTQALVDSGTYVTGRNTVLVDADHNGRLTPNEIGPGGLIQGYFGFRPATDPRFVLNSGVGTATLDRRTVFISDRDFSDTDTQTAYLDLAKDAGDAGKLKLQLFYDALQNRRFVSYGFPADYRARVAEARASWTTRFGMGAVHGEAVVGGAIRGYRGTDKESFNGGNISLDRRDLSVGATPTDIFDDPFESEPGGIGLTWETDVRSHWRDAGLFGTTDLNWGRLSLTLGGRYDDYRVASVDRGTIVFGANQGSASKGDWTWSASLSWRSDLGLMPYVTLAEDSALETNQAGGVAPSLIAGDSWLSGSRLAEAGVKARLWGDVLTGTLAAYRQARTQLSINNAVQGTRARGVELELRWLATRQLSFTFAGDVQKTTVKGPDSSFVVVPPATVGVPGVQGYGGAYALYTLSTVVPGDYTDSLIPHAVMSLYAVYTGPKAAWGQFGATLGATHVSTTSGVVPGAVVLPAYTVANASAYVQRGPWRVSANLDNLTDARFFTPVADVYANVAALPGKGRTWRLMLRRAF